MPGLIRHINKYQQIALLWLLVFALAPCTVKEAWFSVAGLDYTKPLNGSKTTATGQQCQHSHLSGRKIAVQQKTPIHKKSFSYDLAEQTYAVIAEETISPDFIYLRANSPPIYILYKRLKLDIV
ncbi:hypothetical protein [Niabella hibiscisoli]|uniref:hypothetical protein n=1 Tax=Niabella hibiscisoli TaxID=1825928 RepID=UPI001F0F50AB|nr:hypothetical protein [Niabella hibiscisoli]MCH5720364.1 hypothetical protein [Niabella hibiscisoli]